MPFYPDIIMAPKIWLSPRNVTLENVTTYFVRQMNRPLVTRPAVDKAFRDNVTGHLMTSYVAVYGVIFVMTFLVLPLAFFYNALGDAGIDDGTRCGGHFKPFLFFVNARKDFPCEWVFLRF